MSPNELVSTELAQRMCELSWETRRQVGVLIDRRGYPDAVIMGTAQRLWLPDVGRLRVGRGRLRGVRLVHTQLREQGITNDDLTDLSLLRLDFVVVLTLAPDGQPAYGHVAHLLPEGGGSPWRILERQPIHSLDVDPLAVVQALEEEFARASRVRGTQPGKDHALTVLLSTPNTTRSIEARMNELGELCQTAGVQVLDTVVQRRPAPDPQFFVGKGKLEDIVLKANQLGAELLIFDPDLTPNQARVITSTTELKVIDRTMLILDIFAQHATSSDGKLQVELAQLKYSLPRLVEKNTMMSRLTGGIGGRGPGETKLEINRRRAREKITTLERQISLLSEQRQRRRALRQRREVPTVSIVGYTNAGKSTLLNTLTASSTYVKNELFATLDPISRRIRFPEERELIITDTVGFIHDLPQDLVNAFRATLEELKDANLFIHVVDIADAQFEEKIAAVNRIIGELELSETPLILALNKTDLISEEELLTRMRGLDGIPISAKNAESTKPLLALMENTLWLEPTS